ncbi:MAG: tetratricopeptide repeat protein [Gemmataceae bacterium]
MRHIWTWFLVLCCAPLVTADTLKEARERWLRGNYEEASELYQKLAQDPKQAATAAIGQSRVAQSQGQYEAALAVVDKALSKHPQHADLHARRAELLYLRGQWDEAEKAAEKAIAAQDEHFLARWIRAQIQRDRGDLKKADAEIRWFVRTYTNRSNNDNDIENPEELLLVGLAGCENARWHHLSDQFKFILNEVYADALRFDKAFWPAELEAGRLLLEKYNRPEAVDAFDKALTINPQAAEALVGKGIMALQKFEIADAEAFARQALKINPRLPEALRLLADVQLAGGDLAATLQELEKARQVNPRDERTLARIAACHFLQRQQAEFRALCDEVVKHNDKPAIFYQELALRLEERRHFQEAEKYFALAHELQPQLADPLNGLGMLYMRLGREQEAHEVLTKAFEADSFNVRVKNTLVVLRHLQRYETIRTQHFEIRFDPQRDRVLANFMADYLEREYEALAEEYQYRPPGPILFEIFNNHEMFSGRVVALPDLHTIGACTGKMVAMVSPQGQGIRKPFNWARVARHELVHIFNLEQTNFQVPHWFTEGLAVRNEGFPRPSEWDELLRQRVPAGDLMNLDDIHLGFIRPRSPLDWHLAYCQSLLYVEYLRETHGPQAVGRLLQAYADGLNTDDALMKACQVRKEDFEKGYRAYLQQVVAGLPGKKSDKPMSYAELQEAHDDAPTNNDIAARLAEQYLIRRRASDARKLVDAVLKRQARHPLASYVKARLLQAAGEDEEARQLLEAALDPRNLEPKLSQALGTIYFETGEFDKAAKVFEMARQAEPHESKWLTELIRVYSQLDDKVKLIAIYEQLALTDADDLLVRKRLAKLLLDAKRHADAERYARQCLEIDVLDNDAQDLLLAALTGQRKIAEADKLRKVLGR